MYLLNGVPFSIFVLIRDYCIPLSLDGFPSATTLLSLLKHILDATSNALSFKEPVNFGLRQNLLLNFNESSASLVLSAR